MQPVGAVHMRKYSNLCKCLPSQLSLQQGSTQLVHTTVQRPVRSHKKTPWYLQRTLQLDGAAAVRLVDLHRTAPTRSSIPAPALPTLPLPPTRPTAAARDVQWVHRLIQTDYCPIRPRFFLTLSLSSGISLMRRSMSRDERKRRSCDVLRPSIVVYDNVWYVTVEFRTHKQNHASSQERKAISIFMVHMLRTDSAAGFQSWI